MYNPVQTIKNSLFLYGMHIEAITENEFEGDQSAVKINETDKRVKSEDDAYQAFTNGKKKKIVKQSDSDTIASLAGGMNGLGSSIIISKFPRLMYYIGESEI